MRMNGEYRNEHLHEHLHPVPVQCIPLTRRPRGDKFSSISLEGVDMKGNVYPHHVKDGIVVSWKVYFRGDWFTSDEFGRPFRAKFYGLSFLEYLNGLYDPDPRKNRYDPKRFKRQTPYRFDEAFALYLDTKEVGSSSYQKDKGYIGQKYFAPFFANQDFRTIDGVQLENLKKSLEDQKLKVKTIKNIFTVLHAFLNHRLFKSAFYTFPEFPELRYQRPQIEWRTDEEIDQVFEFIHEEDRGYFWAIRGYGLRPEEASGLLRNSLNFETREVRIRTVFVDGRMKNRTKGGAERVIPMELCPEAVRYLVGASRAQSDELANKPRDSVRHERPGLLPLLVFTSNGRAYSPKMREVRWQKAMEQAHKKYGTRPMTLRDLRHSAATKWAEKIPLNYVQMLLGHENIKTTTTFYAHIDLHQVVKRIGER